MQKGCIASAEQMQIRNVTAQEPFSLYFPAEHAGDTKRSMELTQGDFWIEDWLVRPALNRIERGGTVHQLEPRIMRVLVCLAKQPGEVVPRAHLLDTVWPDALLEGDPVNRAISDLRKVFKDDARHPVFIETIRKVGYRLIAPVSMAHVSSDGVASADLAEVVLTTTPPTMEHQRIQPPRLWLRLALGGGVLLVMLYVFWIAQPRSQTPTAPVQPVPFSSLPGIEFNPTFSPDGSRVVFARRDPATEIVDLYIQLVTAKQAIPLIQSMATELSPAWSPDGEWVAYIQREETSCGIFVISALGGIPRRMASCESAEHVTWDASGTSLFFTDRPAVAESFVVHRLHIASGEVTLHTGVDELIWGDAYPAWSPDGQHLAFVRTQVEGVAHLMIEAVGMGMPERHIPLPQRIRGLTWVGDDELVLASDVDGRFSLHRYVPSTGAVTWLLGGGDGVHRPTYHTTSRRLVYEEWQWEKNIWRLPLEGVVASEPSRMLGVHSTRWDHSPQLSPDGQRLAFISNRSGAYEVWVYDQATQQVEPWSSFNGPYLSVPRWSPDGRYLLIDARLAETTILYLIPADGGTPRALNDAADGAWVAPSWSQDGTRVLFGARQGGRWNIWSQQVVGGDPQPVTTSGGFAAQQAPDGAIYFTKPLQAGLWRQRADGSEEQVLADLQAADWANWQVGRQGIYYVRREGEAFTSLISAQADAALVVYDFASAQSTVLHRPAKPVARFALSLASQEQALFYVQVDYAESDLMLVEMD